MKLKISKKLFLFFIFGLFLFSNSILVVQAACLNPSWTKTSCSSGKINGQLDDCAAVTLPWSPATINDKCCCEKPIVIDNTCYWEKSTFIQNSGIWKTPCSNSTVLQAVNLNGTNNNSKCNHLVKPTTTLTYACCCAPPTAASTAKTTDAPLFKIPDFQIKIDTVKLTEVVCVTDLDTGNSVCPVPWIGEYIIGIYNYALSIVGILAAIVLMAGGVMWLISGGDASKITQAKELITGSITGLIILSASYIILYQVNPDLTKMKPIKVDYIGAEDLEPVSNEGNPTNSKVCEDCSTIKEITIKGGSGNQINGGLSYKLYTAWTSSCPSADNCVKWRITEAYPPTSSHKSTCHYNGMCADIGLDPPIDPTDCGQVEKLITIFKNAGLNVLNEYVKCGGEQTDKTTGGHLHVQ